MNASSRPARYAKPTRRPTPLAGHQDEIVGGIGREPAKPCHNRRGVRNVRYGDHRAADSYGAVLFQHAREHFKLARFRHYNPPTG